MENIFEGAKFGDKFIAKNGTIMILVTLLTENAYLLYEDPMRYDTSHFGNNIVKFRLDGVCISDGKYDFDIVRKYKEHLWDARKAFCRFMCCDKCPKLPAYDIEGGGGTTVSCEKLETFSDILSRLKS